MSAGQRMRFKAWVAVGDIRSHVGLGQKCAAEVGIAIRGAHILAELSLVSVRKGYCSSKLGSPYSMPCKLTGKCGPSFELRQCYLLHICTCSDSLSYLDQAYLFYVSEFAWRAYESIFQPYYFWEVLVLCAF